MDLKIQVFDMSTREKIFSLNTRYGFFISISDDSKILATEDESGYITVWSLETGEIISNIQVEEPGYLELSPDGRFLNIYSRDSCLLYDVQAKKMLKEFPESVGTAFLALKLLKFRRTFI